MTKSDLIAFVSEKTQLTKKDAEKAVNAVFEGIQTSLSQGKDAAFPGFGTFKISHRKERMGKNPKTKEVITIAARKSPAFKAGKGLKEAVNA